MDRPGLRWLRSLRTSPRLRVAGPWIGLLILNAFFVLPAVARQLPRQPLLILTHLRQLDFLVLQPQRQLLQ